MRLSSNAFAFLERAGDCHDLDHCRRISPCRRARTGDADQLADLRERAEWKGIALIVHAWAVIFGAMALVAVFPNPLTYVLAVMLIGSRQLGLAILMHEGAHRCFSRDEARNMALSQWLCAYPIFADTQAYRRYHLQHHAHTQQEDDPDLVLSAPFPITKASYRRKLLRDITGRTGYEQRKAQLLNALGDPSWPLARRVHHFRAKLGPQNTRRFWKGSR